MRLVATTRSPSLGPTDSARDADVLQLFHAHADAVYRLARLMLGRADVAEDVVQDTFLKLLRHVGDGRPLPNARGWLLTVAAHACRDRQRAARRWLPWLPERDVRVARERTDAHDAAQPLIAALKQLATRDRALIVLRAEGLSYAEIAATLGVNPVSTGRLVARALERLSRHLDIQEMNHAGLPRR